jgi:glycosyltransferase involved in cell wall biosynthesis
MNLLPKVSIQIPTYNQAIFIARAIESAMMQNYEPLEIIIADDCSADDTETIVKKYTSDSRIKYFKNERNLGRTGNYHKALYEYCTGEWVVNLDGDDNFTSNDFIAEAIKEINQYNDVVFYQASTHAINTEKKTVYRHHHRILENKSIGVIDGKTYFKNFFYNAFFSHLASLYNRKKAMQAGFYEYSNLNSDAESLLKLSLQGNVILDNKVIGNWYAHHQNESSKNIYRKEETLAAWQRLYNYSKKYLSSEEADNWLKKALQYNTQNLMEVYSRQNIAVLFSEAGKNNYWNMHLVKLVAKKLLGRN